eukprot:CAMPEP_0171808998 /NCGR_PEP_ID=MMETSP0991-20121206/76698_1 /TAXON_ID=483369 /ORGANISM="non described non described, Strain CCMP2098" /LENGTH=204 /DNA_ID=CAMNT_0012421985 /DNA_START=417 /DNA_END=1028 /DNA_ORIENTATION=-
MLYLQGTLIRKNGAGEGAKYTVEFDDDAVEAASDIGTPKAETKPAPPLPSLSAAAASAALAAPAHVPLSAAVASGLPGVSSVSGPSGDANFPEYDPAAYETNGDDDQGGGVSGAGGGAGGEGSGANGENVRAPDRQVHQRLVDDFGEDGGSDDGEDVYDDDFECGQHHLEGRSEVVDHGLAAALAASRTSSRGSATDLTGSGRG